VSLRLKLYTRRGCHLCEEMKQVIRQVAEKISFEIREIDVDGSEDLKAQFGQEVPVLFINDRKAFKYRTTAEELKKKLGRDT
jgi:glutaredoxin